jgi:hypothetical protein
MEESRPQTHHLTPFALIFQRTRILAVCIKRGTLHKRAVADKSTPQHRRQRANARRGRELSAAAAARIPHLTRTSSIPRARWSPWCSHLFFLRAHVCASHVNNKHVTERHYERHMRYCHVLAACAGSQIPLCDCHSSSAQKSSHLLVILLALLS